MSQVASVSTLRNSPTNRVMARKQEENIIKISLVEIPLLALGLGDRLSGLSRDFSRVKDHIFHVLIKPSLNMDSTLTVQNLKTIGRDSRPDVIREELKTRGQELYRQKQYEAALKTFTKVSLSVLLLLWLT